MNARFILLADDAYIGEFGKLSAEGIFEDIFAGKFPAKHKRLVIAIRFEGVKSEIGDHNCRISLYDTKNKVILSTDDIAFTLGGIGPVHSAGIISTIRNIIFKCSGGYRFSIFVDDRFLTSVAFTVRKLQNRQANSGAIA